MRSTPPPSHSCTWHIQVPDGYRVNLEFPDLDFAGDGLDCYQDRLDVYDGLYHNQQHLDSQFVKL